MYFAIRFPTVRINIGLRSQKYLGNLVNLLYLQLVTNADTRPAVQFSSGKTRRTVECKSIFFWNVSANMFSSTRDTTQSVHHKAATTSETSLNTFLSVIYSVGNMAGRVTVQCVNVNYEGRTESHEQLFFLHANWEQQTKESAVVDGTSCCVILESLVTSIVCIT